jgi:hypothetical protein
MGLLTGAWFPKYLYFQNYEVANIKRLKGSLKLLYS